MQYDKKPHLVILDGNNTIRALLPLLSLGKETARLNPKLSTSPIAIKINPVGYYTQIPRTCTNNQEPCNQRDKGVVSPFTATCKSEI